MVFNSVVYAFRGNMCILCLGIGVNGRSKIFKAVMIISNNTILQYPFALCRSGFWYNFPSIYIVYYVYCILYRIFQKELYIGILNVTVWRMLRKCLHLKAYKLSNFQGDVRWIACTPVSVNIFVTPATQQHLAYHCIALFWNALHYQWMSHWTITIPCKTVSLLLHYNSSKHFTCSLNIFI
jgi:hypothetical protein